ncbi:BirA family transcriptional regulator, biotin operon repressor / biotin-[acetyl-CoA-carboxylase] ligase [Spirosomataceae bacterium TFI 002]|nr:BirA family transcriptional regulator, biotin operon repressor / biotin-[acetyl-CoA-carboxylase] ligase [Spirosomataceae bacterium TFI 002]
MIKIQPKTKYMGRKVEYLPTCHSTNNYALELLRKTDIISGTIVITDNQTQGRGQRGNEWHSEAGKNLTCTIIYKPESIKASEQFMLNILLSTAIFKTLETYELDGLKIKWPNDIYVNKQKLGGVLIESLLIGSVIGSSIIGIGINLNQGKFELPMATSVLKLTGKEVDRELFLTKLMEEFESNLENFKKKGITEHKNFYLKNLFQMNEWCKYEDAEGQYEGRIVGITAIGEVLVEKELGLMKYGMKEFRYIY